MTRLKRLQQLVTVAITLGSLSAACSESPTADPNAAAGSGQGGVATGGAGAIGIGDAGDAAPGAGAAQGGSTSVGEAGSAGAAGDTSSPLGGAPSGGNTGLDPTQLPAENFDLSRFTLQPPTDEMTSGDNDQISGAALAAYSSPYFYTDKIDGALTFWCPVNGFHTATVHYPRSELRYNSVGGDWPITSTQRMIARFRVTQVPSSKSTVIGQIHGHLTDGTAEVLKLEYTNTNQVVAAFEKDTQPSVEDPRVIGTYSLGELLTYQVLLMQNTVAVSITDSRGETRSVKTTYAAASWAKDTYYFKLGNYIQLAGTTSTDGARIAFYSFDIEPK